METIISNIFAPTYRLELNHMEYNLNFQGIPIITVYLIDANGKEIKAIQAMIDTGSSLNVIHTTLYDKIKMNDSNIKIPIYPLGEDGKKDDKILWRGAFLCYGDSKQKFECIELHVNSFTTHQVEMIIGSVFLMNYCEFNYNIPVGRFSFVLK